MLFLAVFCGFLAEYQLEHKIEHNRAHVYAELLKEDLKKDTAQLNALIEGKEQNNKAKAIQERIWQKPVEKVTWADLKPQEFGLDITPFIWNDASYSQMKSSGNLRLLKSKELIRKLGTYESLIKQIGFLEQRKDGFLKSEHSFRQEVNEEKFQLQHPGVDDSISLKTMGFNFDAWIESNMVSKRVYFYEEWLRELYPQLKIEADTIIGLLNKEYDLK